MFIELKARLKPGGVMVLNMVGFDVDGGRASVEAVAASSTASFTVGGCGNALALGAGRGRIVVDRMDATFDGKFWARMGDFLRELYVLRDVDGLYGTICRGLGDFVAGENVFIGEHDMERTLVTGCVVRHVFETPDFITVVNQCAGEHPLWEPIRTGGQTVRVLSAHASARRWENTRLYKEALGLEGVRDHISVEFGNRKGRLTSIGIFRDRRGFGRRDEEAMTFLIPHFAQALHNARMAEAAGLTGESVEGDRGWHILLDADGRPLHVPDAVRAKLRGFFPDRDATRASLPESVRSWTARGREDRKSVV